MSNNTALKVAHCRASENSASTLCYGFSSTANASTFTNSEAINNSSATGDCSGFFIMQDPSFTIRNNRAVNNTGATGSRGFEIDLLGTEIGAIWGNQSQDHATANYDVTGITIPEVVFTTATGLFSALPTPYDNLSVV
jgi:nitrous oxidase accessory protein NosD